MSGDVSDYYDANTRRFLMGGGATGRTGNLHRSLRLPGVRTAADAIDAVHRVILDRFIAHGIVAVAHRRPLIADLGCGVGASLQWMRAHAHVDVVGITLSSMQARIAARRLGGPGMVHEGSYLAESDIRRMTGGRVIDAAYMIESFVHTDRPEVLFDVLSRHVVPGGLLIICDDFPTRRLLDQLQRRRHGESDRLRSERLGCRLADEFRRGWHIHSFLEVAQVAKLAGRFGWEFVRCDDLSPFVDTGRPRDVVARASALLTRRLKLPWRYWDNVVGGGALQRLIRRGLVAYQVLVLSCGGYSTAP